jgi:hypothetical protein
LCAFNYSVDDWTKDDVRHSANHGRAGVTVDKDTATWNLKDVGMQTGVFCYLKAQSISQA